MATIAHTSVSAFGYQIVTWTGVSSSDDFSSLYVPVAAVAGCMQSTGTFAGGTSVGLTASIVDTAGLYVAVSDTAGSVIAHTASPSLSEFSTAALYLQPTIINGVADSVTVRILIRPLNAL